MDLSVSPVGRPTGGVNDLYAKLDCPVTTAGDDAWGAEDGCPIEHVGHEECDVLEGKGC